MSLVRPAPEWEVAQWLNANAPLSLASLRGKVVVAGAFQMLCPGCVTYLIPQLNQAHALFPSKEVAVIGLHTVFEHHAAMSPVSLEAFLHEYRVTFPVGVDQPSGSSDPLPKTMRRYEMRGTPTLMLIDRLGFLRRKWFGHMPDLQLGAEIAALVGETVLTAEDADRRAPTGCTDAACPAP